MRFCPFLITFSAAVSASAATITVPAPRFADTESATGAVLRAAAVHAPAHVVIDAACFNAGTNAFEIRLATDPDVRCETLDFAFGFDNGRLYARGAAVASLTNLPAVLPSGAFSFRLKVDFAEPDIAAAPVAVSVTPGFEALVPLVRAAHPARWRGVRALSRRTAGLRPAVATSVTDLYFYIRIR